MRYVLPTFQEATLRRGKPLEQFLGGCVFCDEAAIRVVELRPAGGVVEVWLHHAADIGDEEHCDFVPFIFTEDEEGSDVCPVAVLPTPKMALVFAHSELDASPDRWTNQGMSDSEYRDFIRAGRPALWPVAT
jgi:hypothetical protein